ncbi:DNA polymerase I [Granulosicoccaceae sp. 1_MG-2023]|nr:DNA polymerase I [Granulosicoccaceae sp. 1_MG-2023]
MSDKKPLILVDGSSYLFRAFHALPPLTNADGEPTGAVYGVVNMLKRLVKDYGADEVAVVFDAKGKTFRNELYSDYKATRPPMPDDLRVQIAPLHELVEALGFPMIIQEGVEADDVIGTLALQAAKDGKPVIISTGDKDMAQLVDEHITLINTMNNTTMDKDGVVAKFGVKPDQIIDYLALMGDKSDNIPGVPGCGPKTAVKWLDTYGSLQGVIDNAEAIKGKIGEKLRAALETLPLSYELATIRTDCELPLQHDQLQRREPDVDKLAALFSRLGFKAWLAELQKAPSDEAADEGGADAGADAAEPEAVETDYDLVLEEAALDAWLDKLSQADLFAFDTETTSLNYMEAELVGVSFAVEPGKAAYVPFGHDYEGAPAQLSRGTVLGKLKPLLENPELKKVGQHLKYDMNVLKNHGIALAGVEHDTMLESYVLDSTATRHDMDSLADKYLQRQTVHFEDIAGKGKKQLTFNQIGLDEAGHYAAEDADITLQLHQTLWPKLQENAGPAAIYRDIEIPLVPVLSKIESTGVLIDPDMLFAQSSEITAKLAELEQAAFADAGEEFNLNSPKQIQEIFFGKKGFPVVRKTPKGQPSTAEDVLEELAVEHELPRLILQHRGLAKLKSTYTDKLPGMICKASGRVHTSYHQAVASTGRLSSSDPNLQNIPVRTEEGRKIRSAFVAPEGYRIMAADYSQIELRIMAHLSGDEGLLQAFRDDRDVHAATAAEVFGVDADAVDADQRRAAKAINFGLIYGMSAFGLAKQLGVTRPEAQSYIDLYFARYPGVRDYMDQTRVLAAERGYVETVFGRRLYLPEIKSRNAQRRQYAERTAINAPMQGTAADIIKRAMLLVDERLRGKEKDARMIMQVHDELVFEVREDVLEEIRSDITAIMCGAAELEVPLLVEAGVGDNWEEAH